MPHHGSAPVASLHAHERLAAEVHSAPVLALDEQVGTAGAVAAAVETFWRQRPPLREHTHLHTCPHLLKTTEMTATTLAGCACFGCTPTCTRPRLLCQIAGVRVHAAAFHCRSEVHAVGQSCNTRSGAFSIGETGLRCSSAQARTRPVQYMLHKSHPVASNQHATENADNSENKHKPTQIKKSQRACKGRRNSTSRTTPRPPRQRPPPPLPSRSWNCRRLTG